MVEPFGVVESINLIQSEKPVLQAVMPLPEFWEKYRAESNFNKPLFRKPEEPPVVISRMLFHKRKQEQLNRNRKKYAELLSRFKTTEVTGASGFLSPTETKRILNEFGFPLVKEAMLSPEKVKEFNDIDFPLVLKGFAEGVSHKSEFKGVKLNIKNKTELLEAAEEIKSSYFEKGKQLEYFVVQPFLNFKHELLIGAYRDASFGPIVMFGSGGKYVEVFNDVSLHSALLCEEDIEEMIAETKMGKILKGVRGEKPVNIEQIKSVIQMTAELMLVNPLITELDLNPVGITDNDELIIADARIKTMQ